MVNKFTEGVTVRGRVPEADQGNMTFEVELVGGRKVRAPLAPQHLETIIDAFKGYRTGTRVQLQGVGKFNQRECLQGFESIERVSILDPLDVPARLDEFRCLKNGWLDGGLGLAPAREGLDWLAGAFAQRFADGLPRPYLYPTAEGGVQAEWSQGEHEATLEIDLAKHRGQWHDLNMGTGNAEARELDLDDADAWTWVANQVRRMAGGYARSDSLS